MRWMILFILLLSFVSASLDSAGYFKVGEQFTFTQVCSDATYVTLSTIKTPNETLVINQNMTKISEGVFAYNFTPLLVGKYYFEGVSDGCEKTFVTFVTITKLGSPITTDKAIFYSLILFISILIFLGLLIIGLKIKSDYPRDAVTGYIFALNNLKYLKYLLLALSYVCLVWISYLIYSITYSYLEFDFLSEIFRLIFYFLAVLTLPLFIVYVFINIANAVRDSKIKEALERGIRIR